MQENIDSSNRENPFPALSWFCFAFVTFFATPLSVAFSNRGEISIPPAALALSLMLFAGSLTWIGGRWLRRRPENLQLNASAILVSLACVLAVQANVIHPLTYFGAFDGDLILFRRYGAWFWFELVAFIGLPVLLFAVVRRWPEAGKWAAWMAIASCAVVLAQSAWEAGGASRQPQEIPPTVYEFSRQGNLVHLLPDGLQTDTVIEVLRNDDDLAKAFEGFSLFVDHLGQYHGTAPSLPAMLTGEPFDFSRGHIYSWIGPHIEKLAYQNALVESGWTVDMVPIHEVYCISRSRSCLPRPFNDWKSRGIRQFQGESLSYSLAVLADLSLYRMSPSFLKEKIHGRGNWWLAGVTADGASPYPDPVLREWRDSMSVVDGPPSYRFYHYIGTHKPPFWDADCNRNEQPGREKSDFEAQATCILKGIAALLDGLKARGLYDNTAVLITGDHGHGTAPAGLRNAEQLPGIDAAMVGTARPLLLVKPVDSAGALRFSAARSSLTDIAELGVSLAAARPLHEFEQSLVDRPRWFYHYSIEGMRRWAEQAIDHETLRVEGPALDGQSWSLAGMSIAEQAPSAFPDMNYRTTGQFLRGADIRTGDEAQKGAWVRRATVGFLLSPPGAAGQPLQLELKLHLPDWIGQQSLTAHLNGEPLAEDLALEPGDGFFTRVVLTIDAGRVLTGNNFFSLQFGTPFEQPGSHGRLAYAMLAAVHLAPAPMTGKADLARRGRDGPG